MQRRPQSADQWASDEAPRHAGRFVARITPSGERLFYFRYLNPEGKQVRYPIGSYDASGRRGLTLSHARDRAGELSKLYKSGVRDIRGYEERRLRAEAAQRQAEEEARKQAEQAASAGSLRALLEAYWKHLERNGKASAADVRRLLTRHVIHVHPALASRKAAELRARDLRPVLAALVTEGKGRTAAKIRAFIRAACALALRAETDASVPAEFLNFALEMNPADALASLSQFNRKRERTLSEAELRAFLCALDAVKNPIVRAALQVDLYLGGQRGAQLLRAAPAGVDLHGKVIRLLDPKGRRPQARVHDLPLTDQAAEIIAPLLERNAGKKFVFSADGERACSRDTLSKTVSKIAAALLADQKVVADFDFRDLRGACETHIARLGVTKDHRAQIQSHGLGGVQDRHYDRHDYMNEKRAALERWVAYLDELKRSQPTSNVVPLRRQA